MNDAAALNNFSGNSASFKFEPKIISVTGDKGTKNGYIEIFKYFLENSWNAINQL